jgi:hypothetical protein
MIYEMKQIETVLGTVNCLEMTTNEGVTSTIPLDPANSDYQAYLLSLETTND